MPVAAMGRGQQVRADQIDADTGGNRLLAGGKMKRPAHQRRLAGRGQTPSGDTALTGDFGSILEGANARHHAIQLKQALV